MEEKENFQLIISESDFDERTIGRINAVSKGQIILSDENKDIKRTFFDSLPSIVAKRVQTITPNNFSISEIELKMTLGGKVFGAEIGGEIVVKLSPT